MAASGLVTFLGSCECDEFHIFLPKHGDPETTIALVRAARVRSGEFYEVDTFSASFVAEAVLAVSDVRLLPSGDWEAVAPLETQFHCVVADAMGGLRLTIFRIRQTDGERRDSWIKAPLFNGSLADALNWKNHSSPRRVRTRNAVSA